jgi:hypothetical protein
MMMQIGERGVMLQRKSHGGYVVHDTGLVHAATLCCPNFAPRRIVIGADGIPGIRRSIGCAPIKRATSLPRRRPPARRCSL